MVKYAGRDGGASDNLYISGLPSPQVDQSLLGELFSGMGLTVVRSRVIPDTKGMGCSAAMVQLASQEEAAQAIASLNGNVAHGLVRGTTLSVKYAGGEGSAPSDNLYITGLPSPQVDQATLVEVFASLEFTVVRSKIIPDTKGLGSSAAMVQLASQQEAESAILALDGETFSAVNASAASAPAPNAGVGMNSGPALKLKYAGDGSQADNLYITGLPSPPPDQAVLVQVFADLGLTVVRSKIIPDTRGTGISAAMVQLASQDEAAAAIDALSGKAFPSFAASPAATSQAVSVVPPRQVTASCVVPPRQAPGGAPLMVKYAGGDAAQPSNNLYLRGLPNSLDQAALNQVFADLGLSVVRSKVIPDTRGMGNAAAMVQLASQEEADSAIVALNGEAWPSTVQPRPTRPLVVPPLLQTQQTASPGATMRVKYAGGDGSQESDNLYISGLPSPAPDTATLNGVFESLGLTVVRSKVIPDTRGIGISAAMVQLASPEEAATAIASLQGQAFPASEAPGPPGPGGGAMQALPALEPPRPARPALVVPPRQQVQPAASAGTTLRVKYAGDGSQESDNLYISGLPSPAPDTATLNSVFEGLGLTVVRSKVIPDTRGIGVSAAMVQLASQEEAASAIAALSGQVFPAEGCELLAGGDMEALPVAEPPRPARPALVIPPRQQPALVVPPRQQVQAAASAGTTLRVKYAGGDGSQESDNLYISGLPSPAPDTATLNGIFEGLGLTVVRSKIIPDTRGIGISAAMVQLASLEQAANAIATLNGQVFPAAEGCELQAGIAMEAYPTSEVPPPAAPVVVPARRLVVPARRVVPPPLPQAASTSALRVKYAGDGSQESDNLYISGLPSPAPDTATLNGIFEGLGLTVVRSKVIPDTRGFGNSAAMVQLASQEEAASAIASLNGQAMSVAEPRGSPGAAAGSAEMPWSNGAGVLKVKYAGDGSVPSDNLYLSGLPNPAPSQEALHQVFANLGLTVTRSKVIPDTRGLGHCAAMVQLASQEEAALAISSLSGLDAASIGTAMEVEPAAGAAAAAAAGAPPSQNNGPLLVKYKGGLNTPSDTLHITGLPSPQIEEASLLQMFESVGCTVLRSTVIADTRGSGSSAAIVQVASETEAAAAIEAMSGQYLNLGEPAAEAPGAEETMAGVEEAMAAADQTMEAAEEALGGAEAIMAEAGETLESTS